MPALPVEFKIPLRFSTQDRYPLWGTFYGEVAGVQPTVLIAGALGVSQRFYDRFARWLAAQGFRAMTFDLRGIGDSLQAQGHVSAVQADMLLWAQQDFAAAVEALCVHAGVEQVNVLGHSLGAHHAVMSTPAAQTRIAKLVSVAAGAGSWRDWALPSRLRAPLMLHLAGPLLTPVFGYFPGRRLGMIGDLPAGVMHQFSRWCRHDQFAWEAEPDKVLPSLCNARFPIHAISFTDDEAMTLTCTRKLLSATPNAPVTLEQINPQQMDVAAIGHLGAFRKGKEVRLWPHLASLLTGS